MSQREHTRHLEDAIDRAAAECLRGNPTAAYAVLAPFASDDAKANPPETTGSGAAPGAAAPPPAPGATTPGQGGDPGSEDRSREERGRKDRRSNPRRRRSLF